MMNESGMPNPSVEGPDDDDDVHLYKLQTRVLKNLHHIFPCRPAREAKVQKKINNSKK
jgi:hypothetical protein